MTAELVLQCTRCGKSTRHVGLGGVELTSFTCGACNHFHDLTGKLPPDPLLAHAVKALGGVVSTRSVLVPTRPYAVEVSIDFDSGSPNGVHLHARTPPLPDVKLTRESPNDRSFRAAGLTREVQLDDPSFDPHVWVDGAYPDEVVKRLLSPPELRRAVVALLHGEHVRPNTIPSISIALGEHGIVASVGLSILQDATALRAAVEAVATVARTVPIDPGARAAEQKPRAAVSFALWAGIAVAVLAIPACVGSRTHPPVFDDGKAVWIGLGAGFVAWLLVIPLLALLVRGRSSSLTTLVVGASIWLLALEGLGANVLGFANWALDTARPVERRVRIQSVMKKEGDDGPFAEVEVVGWRASGETFRVYRGYPGPAKPGGVLTLKTRRGRFGWDWLEE